MYHWSRTSSCRMPVLKLAVIRLLQGFTLAEIIGQISWFDKVSTVKLAKHSLHIQTIRELVRILLIYYTWIYTEFKSKLWRHHCFIYRCKNRHHALDKIPRRAHKTLNQSPLPICNLPGYPALLLQLNEPFPYFSSHLIQSNNSLFWLLPRRRLPVSSKRKTAKIKNSFPSPFLQYSFHFRLHVQKFLKCSPIQGICFPLSPVTILPYPLLAPFPQRTNLPCHNLSILNSFNLNWFFNYPSSPIFFLRWWENPLKWVSKISFISILNDKL